MAESGFLLTIDQGTTSTRAIAFGLDGELRSSHQVELEQHYPAPGWVEHDAEEIWSATIACCRAVIDREAGASRKPLAIGITNQRETTVLWDRATGAPVHRAIVWQDRRTADACAALKAGGHEAMVTAKTGLLLDPYFSATKVAWILNQDDALKERAAAGGLAFGTVDSYLLYRLTGGRHATDITNASRTMLFDIHARDWSDELLELIGVPAAVLPEVLPSAGEFGTCVSDLFGAELPIAGIAGDQQAAAIGQGCFAPGSIKSTYGTGCFLLQNTGGEVATSRNKLLATVAYEIDGRVAYALEGSIFMAGATVQWLRDSLKIVDASAETAALAASVDGNDGVYLVPAFTGLGAPQWNPNARGTIVGMTRNSGRAHFARAALEAVAYQTHDLIDAVAADSGERPEAIRIDGGMAANDWFAQFLADTIGVPVDRPKVTETTALGAGFLAGLGVGCYGSTDQISEFWMLDRRFEPAMEAAEREKNLAGWRRALRKCLLDEGEGEVA
ncbi:MAG: glycerol kinase GlpK [Sphingomonadales bacterium]|nr:glycerol kinase GlpK [Sphingomonadales bacterium]